MLQAGPVPAPSFCVPSETCWGAVGARHGTASMAAVLPGFACESWISITHLLLSILLLRSVLRRELGRSCSPGPLFKTQLKSEGRKKDEGVRTFFYLTSFVYSFKSEAEVLRVCINSLSLFLSLCVCVWHNESVGLVSCRYVCFAGGSFVLQMCVSYHLQWK